MRSPAALAVTAILSTVGLAIATFGASLTPVTAQELMGPIRSPGEPAFMASHRGDAESAPENTLASVRAALDGGYDYVEVDVALTADDVPILMHDATVDRTTDGSGAVRELSLREIKGLDAGGWFASEFQGEPVPTAREFLDLVATGNGRAIVELKGEWSDEAVASLIDDISARGLERRIALASFDARPLSYAARISEVIPRIAILRHVPEDLVSVAREMRVTGVIVKYSALGRDRAVVDALHDAGLRVIVYTLNVDGEWDEALGLGVDGIVTDAPAGLFRWQKATIG